MVSSLLSRLRQTAQISPTKFLGVSGDATDTNNAIFVFEK